MYIKYFLINIEQWFSSLSSHLGAQIRQSLHFDYMNTKPMDMCLAISTYHHVKLINFCIHTASTTIAGRPGPHVRL